MKSIIVTCPKCREVLEIDLERKAVVKHHPEVKAAPGGDFLKDRLKSLEEEKARRAALVADSKSREKQRQERNEEIARKVRDQAQEGPPEEPPVREMDLD